MARLDEKISPRTAEEEFNFDPWEVGERLFRMEVDIQDCVVEGTIPDDLNGMFHRVGPDPQFPLRPGNIPFDGEGHASLFQIKDGRVDFKSRYVRNDRYIAQDRARRLLYPMYRNPSLDDPSVKHLSRSTHNTSIMPFGNIMLAFKEDSLPAAMDPFTLETLDANFDFNATVPSVTVTAHPKYDSHSGNFIAFGAEAEGDRSDVISIFEYTQKGELVWQAKVHSPYISLVHDIAVTENFVAFFLQPLTLDEQQMAAGGIRWSWDGRQPSYLGCLRRGGDGSDVKWVKGPAKGMFHFMGAFDDNETIYLDAPISDSNIPPFMPMKEGHYSPMAASPRLTRISMNMAGVSPSDYKLETMYPIIGELPRQDDRYHTVPYRFGFQPSIAPDEQFIAQSGFTCYVRYDHQTKSATYYKASPTVMLGECVFAPKHENAREGEGYLMGVASHTGKGGIADLLIFDAEHIDEGPMATVKLPSAIAPQIHGWWSAGNRFTKRN